MTDAGWAEPEDLRQAFGRIAEGKGARPGDVVDTGHLKRQSLAAHRFVEAVGHRARYDHARAEWFLWQGHRWHRDQDDGIKRLWLEVLADRYRQALGIGDDGMRQRTIEAVQAAGALDSAITAGLRIAASMVPVTTTGAEWDPDPWRLGCDNGVVDLRSGLLRPGRPEDLITRSTGLSFDAAAACPRWERFLTEVFAADDELIEWFGRLVGASLTGTSKEIVGIHHGVGNNGKSVCFKTLGRVAGDYGLDIAVETLLGGRRDAGAPTSDLMRLRGARLVFTSEPNQGARLNGGQLKRLATTDRMSGRELHGRQQEWDPTHTVHLATNHLPDVDDASDGFWRRIALIPWDVRFGKAGEPGSGPREDPGLADVLAGEGPGILAWIVRHAVEFAAAGSLFPLPTAVVAGTAAYRADEDVLHEFIRDEVMPADQVTVITEIFEAYQAWADRVDLPKAERMASRKFGREFAARYARLGWRVVRSSRSGRTTYRGLRVRQPGESAATGGSGGYERHSAGSSHADRESGETGDSANRPTSPTSGAYADHPPRLDEDLAERATDDDAEDRP